MTSPAPSRRRWFRLSLRTLFLVVTLLGVWLGLYRIFGEIAAAVPALVLEMAIWTAVVCFLLNRLAKGNRPVI